MSLNQIEFVDSNKIQNGFCDIYLEKDALFFAFEIPEHLSVYAIAKLIINNSEFDYPILLEAFSQDADVSVIIENVKFRVLKYISQIETFEISPKLSFKDSNHNRSNLYHKLFEISFEVPNLEIIKLNEIVIKHDFVLLFQECVKRLMRTVSLDQQNMWECSGCHKKVLAEQSLKFVRLPPILVIHFMRFSTENGISKKNFSKVQFPDEFDAFLLIENSLAKFKLFAVCEHIGMVNSGHYRAYCSFRDENSPEKETWYFLDDTNFSNKEITAGSQVSNAYLLFYHKYE